MFGRSPAGSQPRSRLDSAVVHQTHLVRRRSRGPAGRVYLRRNQVAERIDELDLGKAELIKDPNAWQTFFGFDKKGACADMTIDLDLDDLAWPVFFGDRHCKFRPKALPARQFDEQRTTDVSGRFITVPHHEVYFRNPPSASPARCCIYLIRQRKWPSIRASSFISQTLQSAIGRIAKAEYHGITWCSVQRPLQVRHRPPFSATKALLTQLPGR